ncbi:MAG: 16S rRNA (cytidine(1402)-2'-O)-methyltransferase [Clostridia bacterium]|nr:16S rRNA (cytidine(1402)-2'-O)-methyltransferase [Clostridia bacterium]MBR0406437.1 16S rRNA (cytidine(1402)-2'-O)-methyltransferase [Clostridia bacterium]
MSTLYVVATPIGNLGDMSPHAVETLKSVSLIAAEDTRVTKKLTNHFGIDTPLVSCHQHNEKGRAPEIVQRMLAEDIDVAVVTDAGTPAISDPGTELVRAAADAGIPVIAVAGPTAFAAAVSVSGFDFSSFTFYGFLPRGNTELKEKLLDIGRKSEGAIFHESPHRVKTLVAAIADTLPGAMLSVSCDLTKLHELTLRGTPESILSALEANEKSEKGEYCVVADLRGVKLPEEKPTVQASLEARIFDLVLNGASLRDAIDALTEQGEKKNAVKAAALRVKEWVE